MQQVYRATRWLRPEKGMTIVRNAAEAETLIASIEKNLKTDKRGHRMSKSKRENLLLARASIYTAIGSRQMLEAALEAYHYCKSSNSAALVASANHHFGRLTDAVEFYKLAYQYPHEAGWEVDLSHAQSLLMLDRWDEAWEIIKTLKKRMVYAAYLPNWDGQPCDEVSIIAEGGFGDILHMSRYIPMVCERVKKVTVYLPPMFFESGFVDLCKLQSWFCDIKILTDAPKDVLSTGFFDLPVVFKTQPNSVPTYPQPWRGNVPAGPKTPGKPLVGFCWAARQMETPILPDGVYRSLTVEQVADVVSRTFNSVSWVGLQKDETFTGIFSPDLKSWVDTANIIANLDAVVTVDTGVAHLSAAMGKPTYVLLSGAVDWKYSMSGDKCRWYDKMILVRNDDFGFDNSVEKIIGILNSSSQNELTASN